MSAKYSLHLNQYFHSLYVNLQRGAFKWNEFRHHQSVTSSWRGSNRSEEYGGVYDIINSVCVITLTVTRGGRGSLCRFKVNCSFSSFIWGLEYFYSLVLIPFLENVIWILPPPLHTRHIWTSLIFKAQIINNACFHKLQIISILTQQIQRPESRSSEVQKSRSP